MTRAPWVQAKPDRAWGRPGEAYDTSIGWRFANPALVARDKATYSMPATAEEVARIDGVPRADADAFALRSHPRAIAAIDGGRLAPELAAVPTRPAPITVPEVPPPRPPPQRPPAPPPR